MNNFVIGTANFFHTYGLLKSNVKKNEILKILRYIKKIMDCAKNIFMSSTFWSERI